MPKLKIDEERPVFLRNTVPYFVSRNNLPRHFLPTPSELHRVAHIAGYENSSKQRKTSKFHLLFLYLYFNDPLNKYQYSIYKFAAVCIYQLTSKLANLSKDKKLNFLKHSFLNESTISLSRA